MSRDRVARNVHRRQRKRRRSLVALLAGVDHAVFRLGRPARRLSRLGPPTGHAHVAAPARGPARAHPRSKSCASAAAGAPPSSPPRPKADAGDDHQQEKPCPTVRFAQPARTPCSPTRWERAENQSVPGTGVKAPQAVRRPSTPARGRPLCPALISSMRRWISVSAARLRADPGLRLGRARDDDAPRRSRLSCTVPLRLARDGGKNDTQFSRSMPIATIADQPAGRLVPHRLPPRRWSRRLEILPMIGRDRRKPGLAFIARSKFLVRGGAP